MGTTDVIQKGNTRNLVQALLVAAGNKAYDTEEIIGTIFNKVYICIHEEFFGLIFKMNPVGRDSLLFG